MSQTVSQKQFKATLPDGRHLDGMLGWLECASILGGKRYLIQRRPTDRYPLLIQVSRTLQDYQAYTTVNGQRFAGCPAIIWKESDSRIGYITVGNEYAGNWQLIACSPGSIGPRVDP